MIPPEYIPAIAQRLKTLQGPVKIDYFHQTDGALIVPGRQPCPGCAPALELLQELAALHDELELRVHDFHASGRRPASGARSACRGSSSTARSTARCASTACRRAPTCRC